jgi:hypothetical protein
MMKMIMMIMMMKEKNNGFPRRRLRNHKSPGVVGKKKIRSTYCIEILQKKFIGLQNF